MPISVMKFQAKEGKWRFRREASQNLVTRRSSSKPITPLLPDASQDPVQRAPPESGRVKDGGNVSCWLYRAKPLLRHHRPNAKSGVPSTRVWNTPSTKYGPKAKALDQGAHLIDLDFRLKKKGQGRLSKSSRRSFLVTKWKMHRHGSYSNARYFARLFDS
jgi:hypothetical protein